MRKVLFFIATMFTLTAHADLNEVMEVLKYVETVNTPTAVGDNGTSFGVLQIQKACVDDVNRYYGTSYSHQQMFKPSCAEEVFKLYTRMGIERYIKKYGIEPTTEVIVRNWNGGIYQGYRIVATEEYYQRYVYWRQKLKCN